MRTFFGKSVLAGMLIALGGTAYLTQPNIIGAVLFSFGLLAVVHYQALLYTGSAGFVKLSVLSHIRLLLILCGNVIGCCIIASLIRHGLPHLIEQASNIATSRISLPWHTHILRGILCGMIMTVAVNFAKKQQYLPLLFGVPLFITCGFEHSIADAFYYVIYGKSAWLPWILTVVGNYIGCNIPRKWLYE